MKSAARTLEILEYFDEVQHPLNVVGVAAALGYPQSSAAALLRSLTAMGYLHYNRKKRTYMPTDRVPFLGSWINPPLFEEGALPRLMRAVGKRSGQLVVLAARNGDMAQYIHVLNEPSAVAHHIRIGQKRPLATSGVGQMLLSSMDEREVRRLYHRMNAYASSPEDKVDIPELLAELSTVKARGYTFSRNRVVNGYGVIALAIPKSCTSRALALGVGGLCETLEQREAEIVETIREEMKSHLKLVSLGPTDAAKSTRAVRIPTIASLGVASEAQAQRVA
ncbi:MAG: helix-turn-helix domain-containing protein [Xanthobacteraceae bacterium]|nr:helix-turn-helix domain-containing protein [Xanthobacteraceae bacterium]